MFTHFNSESDLRAGTALITGASSGIGAVYADRLARRGHDLVLVARDQERLQAVAALLINDTGRSVQVMVADLNKREDRTRVEQILRTNADITVLVNNAGIAMSGDLGSSDPDRLESMIQLNVVVPALLARAVVPGFVARRRGTLINIGSAVALAPELYHGVYSGSKAFMLTLSLRLREELKGHGIQVQAVLPGAVRTAIWAGAGMDLASLPPEALMDVDDLVDAALAGLDRGESVTIPSLPNVAEWNAFEAARHKLGPNLSRRFPAMRFGIEDVRSKGLRSVSPALIPTGVK